MHGSIFLSRLGITDLERSSQVALSFLVDRDCKGKLVVFCWLF